MADTCEESSSEGSDSILSDNFSIYPESSTSDEDEQKEEASASRSSLGKRKSRTEKSSSSSKQAKTKTKRSANDDQMEELTSWIFSTLEAGDVEGNICEKLLGSLLVKSVKERERCAKHLISEPQKLNFRLLVGFCRKFSTLVSECSLLADKPNRKAAFFSSLNENARKFSSWEGYSREIDYRTGLSRTV